MAMEVKRGEIRVAIWAKRGRWKTKRKETKVRQSKIKQGRLSERQDEDKIVRQG